MKYFYVNTILFTVFCFTFMGCHNQKSENTNLQHQPYHTEPEDSHRALSQNITKDSSTGSEKTKPIGDRLHENQDSLASNSTKQNTAFFDKDCVIFLWPDSTELVAMQIEYGDMDYIEIINDMNWYTNSARMILDSIPVENFLCSKETIILQDSKHINTRLKRKELQKDVILFNINKQPVFVYSSDFDQKEVLRYFDIETGISTH